MKLILNPEYKLYEKDSKVFCDSLQIAEMCEKQHKNLIRDIENILENDNFSRLNFELSTHKVKGKA